MPIQPKAFAHIRITVTDIERSRAFYDAVLGLPVAYELPPDADEASVDRSRSSSVVSSISWATHCSACVRWGASPSTGTAPAWIT